MRSAVLGPRFPLFVKPVHEGSLQGDHRPKFLPHRRGAESAGRSSSSSGTSSRCSSRSISPAPSSPAASSATGEGARLLPIVGMNFAALPEGALPIYGFEAKWLWDRPENPLDIFECPARIDERLSRRDRARRPPRVPRARLPRLVADRRAARRDGSAERGRGESACREFFPNPADNSCFPKAARVAGMSYDELIQACLRAAAERQGVRYGTRNEDRGSGSENPARDSRCVLPRSSFLVPRGSMKIALLFDGMSALGQAR